MKTHHQMKTIPFLLVTRETDKEIIYTYDNLPINLSNQIRVSQ